MYSIASRNRAIALLLATAVLGCGGTTTPLEHPETPREFSSSAPERTALRITFLDVGQGDCIVINCPDGSDYVVDCGSHPGGGLERRSSVRARFDSLLRDSTVEGLVVTHADADHVNLIAPGAIVSRAPSVLGGRSVGAAILGGELAMYEGTATGQRLIAMLDKHTDVQHPNASNIPADGAVLPWSCGEGTEIVMVAAGETTPGSTAHRRNTASVVLIVRRGGYSVMLAGDATHTTEERMLERFAGTDVLNIDFLKVAHHGGETSTAYEGSSAWLDATTPAVALISAANRNAHGHPRCEIVEALDAALSVASPDDTAAECDCSVGSSGWTTFECDPDLWFTGRQGNIELVVGHDGSATTHAMTF